MIRPSDLASLTVRQIIFHDVPNNPRGGNGQPTLTDTETTTDAKRVGILKKRLTQVFGSGAAFEVEFLASTASPVPSLVLTLTSQVLPSNDFIEASRKMAQYLFEKQMGSTSPGLLCVVAVTCGSRTGVAIMKLEREEGADLHLKRNGSHSAFEMSVLDNLVLTDGTRLFKSALFLTNGAALDCLACDSQSDPMSRSDAAKCWLAFLGCRFVVDPAIATQKWFDTSVDFVNQEVQDPIEKQALYEHLVSELNSNRPSVSPKKFVQDYVKRDLRQPYEDFLKENDAPMRQFSKDTSDIQSKLRRLSYHTHEGLALIVPVDKENLVEVAKTQIVVRDTLQTISRK
jgi:37-kD nucleoid-associated bacterial protein